MFRRLLTRYGRIYPLISPYVFLGSLIYAFELSYKSLSVYSVDIITCFNCCYSVGFVFNLQTEER